MPDRLCTIAEMFEATVARRGDSPAIGIVQQGVLDWRPWPRLLKGVRADLEFLSANKVPTRGRLLALLKGNNEYGVTLSISLPKYSVVEVLVQDKSQGAYLRFRDMCGACGYIGGADYAPPTLVEPSSGQSVSSPSDLASIFYTSGTCGEPRGIALSHQNLVSNTIAVADTIAASLDEDPRDEVRLSFLPFSHLYARVCDLYCWIYRGSKLVLAESRDTIFRDCQIAKPTAINGVPYFFQKVIDLADREKTPIKKLLGGEVRRCYSGGAALSPEIEKRFWDEGVPLLNGYGLSEASPVVTVSTIKDYKLGTVGKPLPGVDVRIAADGEVLVRGPNVMMGYWGPDGIDEAATAEVIRDGWLHTGDLGSLDADGFLTIHGRKKETLVLSTGKNISPSRIEALLCASPWIEQCAVVGDGRKHLAAVVVPNPDRVRAEVKRRRLWVWSKKSALRHQAVRSVFEQEIGERLAGLLPHEQVRAFTLLPRGFSQEAGEMTAKLSLRRGVIETRLAGEIAGMYSD